MNILKRAKQAIKREPEIFAILEEYDRTGKLRKLSYKERANFTIDADLLRRFRSYCRKHGFSMSAKIEQHIQQDLS